MFGLGLGLGIHRHSSANPYAFPFISRVESDGGAIRDKAALLNLTYYLQSMMPNTKLLYCPELGVKLRTSGINNYVTKLYDISSNMLDGTQTTALYQPYLSGNIAPNEKYALKNSNGDPSHRRLQLQNQISFGNNQPWSLSIIINWNGDNYANGADVWQSIIGGTGLTSRILLNYSGLGKIYYSNTSYKFHSFNKKSQAYVGKTALLNIIVNLSGKIDLYINGILFDTITISDTAFNIDYLAYPSGYINYTCVRDIALSPTQVQDEYNYLRSLFPEIESVQIGTQTWATSNCEMISTPQGNIIREIQAATNVERITNAADREFSSDTGWWTKVGDVVISNGVCNIKSTGPISYIIKNILTVGKQYKLTYTIARNAFGVLYIEGLDNPDSFAINSNVGTHTYYLVAFKQSFVLKRGNSCDIDVDNLSIEEVGWSDSTNIYNAIYAQTSGTSEQKEYAAVKAAAMWGYYNNDSAVGAVYGKLYNWYAVRLLQMDIDYYNAANPMTPWGWRVPTSADFNVLLTYLGGTAIAGGKMKKEGTLYWDTPNTGATNESGFSSIGCGYRDQAGPSYSFKSIAYYRSQSYEVMRNKAADTTSGQGNDAVRAGFSLRLIKA